MSAGGEEGFLEQVIFCEVLRTCAALGVSGLVFHGNPRPLFLPYSGSDQSLSFWLLYPAVELECSLLGCGPGPLSPGRRCPSLPTLLSPVARLSCLLSFCGTLARCGHGHFVICMDCLRDHCIRSPHGTLQNPCLCLWYPLAGPHCFWTPWYFLSGSPQAWYLAGPGK